jgi:hypothetical protein
MNWLIIPAIHWLAGLGLVSLLVRCVLKFRMVHMLSISQLLRAESFPHAPPVLTLYADLLFPLKLNIRCPIWEAMAEPDGCHFLRAQGERIMAWISEALWLWRLHKPTDRERALEGDGWFF